MQSEGDYMASQTSPSALVAEATATDLQSLLARLEAATGPDCELSFQIDRLLLAPRYTGTSGTWYGHPAIPHLTASLDAALALVERVLPGADWSSTPGYPDGKRRGQTLGVHVDHPIGPHWATHDVPPIALLAAMLKALIASRAEADGALSRQDGLVRDEPND